MAQLGREAEGRKPSIADLRESGAFEQDADQVWIMHRERAKDSNETNIPTDVYIAKNRNGACGTAKLFFQPQFIRFVDKAPGFYDKIAEEK
jgi:replicative DNA helicase